MDSAFNVQRILSLNLAGQRVTLGLMRTAIQKQRAGDTGACVNGRHYSDLIVPFGNKVVTAGFCTTTSVPFAISNVT